MKTLYSIILLTVVNLLALQLSAQQTWNGSSGSDWETDANWTPGPFYPDYSEDVTIPSGTPNEPIIQNTPGSPVECNNLTIDAGAILTIQGDGAQNIYGNVNNSGDIIISG